MEWNDVAMMDHEEPQCVILVATDFSKIFKSKKMYTGDLIIMQTGEAYIFHQILFHAPQTNWLLWLDLQKGTFLHT